MGRVDFSIRSRVGATLVAGLLAVVVSSCAGSTPASVSSPTPGSPSAAQGDFAGLVDIGGGRKLYLECHGSGSPTVILQSGVNNGADIWGLAEAHPPAAAQGVAQFTRVCAYDRPGSLRFVTDAGSPAPSPLPGRSDPAPMPRTLADVVGELHTLLATAGVPGPYVLVGHSLGGLLSLLYARTYPDQVAGLVIVDGTPPPIERLLTRQQFEQTIQQPLLHPDSEIPGYQQEAYDVSAGFKQIDAAPPLRPMPVVMLVRGKPAALPDPPPPGFPVEAFAALDRAWPQAQGELAASIPGARLITVPDTTHYVHTQRPDSVIEAIRQVIGLPATPRPS